MPLATLGRFTAGVTAGGGLILLALAALVLALLAETLAAVLR